MRKNGSRLISLKRYRATDLFLFTVILAIFDLLAHFAIVLLPGGAFYMFTLTVPIVLLMMMRWGWWGVLYAIFDGVVLSALNAPNVWQNYLSYSIGNAAILLLLIPLHYIGKQKIAGKWYLTALFVVLGWLVMNLFTSFVQFICGEGFLSSLLGNMGFGLTGFMSLAVGMILLLVLRKLDGMFEDQIHYLKRLDEERKEQMRLDEFGEKPVEIDEDTLSILKKRDEELQ